MRAYVCLLAALLLAGSAVAAPSISGVNHSPAIPQIADDVRVQAQVGANATAVSLRWRLDAAPQFQVLPMADVDGDDRWEASIPAQADQAIVEFFVEASDGLATSTWPAEPISALFQVDESHDEAVPWTPGAQPIYRAVLTGAARAALSAAPHIVVASGTLVTVDGTGTLVHYLCEFRSPSAAPPQSFDVRFPQDAPWNGRAGFLLNGSFPESQVLGAAIFRRAGLPVAEAVPVRFRLNGVDLANGARYARVEPIDAAWIARQYPLDPAGNLYAVSDQGPGTHGELAYETPATAANYAETYFKLTNAAANDYGDLIALTNKLSNAPEVSYKAELAAVLNLDQWLGFLALDALLGNVKPGLQSGRGHDFSLYRGGADPRFVLVPGELDTVFGLGENGTGDAITRGIFGYEGVAGLNRVMRHADILPDYYAKLLALMDTTFTHAALDELIEQSTEGWVDAVTVQAMKDFITLRRANVSAQIPQTFAVGITTGAPDVEGIKTTTDGTALVAGNFHVARARSIRVNGQPATLHYRASGPNAAGTWSCALTSGLNRGMNIVTAKFYDGANGTGEVVEELSTELFYSGGVGTNISGNIGGGNAQALLSYGTGGTGTSATVSGTPGSSWRVKHDYTNATIGSHPATWKDEGFDDSSWIIRPGQTGYGNNDENQTFARVDYDAGTAGTQNVPSYFFRATFTIADLAQVASVTGQIKYDDAYRIYINGVKVLNSVNLPDATPITAYANGASADNTTANITIPLANLHDGVNTIAVEVHQASATSGDVTFDLRLDALPLATPEVRWTLAGSPYRLTGDATVPAGVTLVVEPGVSVFADHTRRLTVGGIIKVLGTADVRVRFSHFPGAPPQDDPREPGTQSLPPKWGGILLTDSLSPDNVIRYADFVNAQPAAVEGCITVVRSECLVEHCSFRSTYLHGVYGKNCSLTVQDCHFPDVFPPGKEALGEVLDNLSEFVEVDSPPNDPGVVGNPLFIEGFPIGGHLRLYRNLFEGSSGHNDLVDVTAGKWGVTPILDVQDNHFRGPTGDEHIDLNGDSYIAGNFFENCKKDAYTSDNGYANAVSSDLGGTDTTVVVARNVFTHVDHAVNVKRGSGVIFEHNTMADVNADYVFTRGAFTQNVRGSAVNFFIPEDTGRAGDGAYAAFNLFFGQAGGAASSRVFSWADMDLAGQPPKTTKIEMAHNFLDAALQDPFIGSRHPDNVLAAVWQPRFGNPLFVDRAARNYELLPHSPARGTAPYGLDYGATIAPGVYLGGVPPSITPGAVATITIGGPGIFAFKWRLDGGAWSAPVEIAPGVFSRTMPTIRTATLNTPTLSDGPHSLEVIGQDFAGNWQNVPTTAAWTVNTALQRVLINEVLADGLAAPDTIELHNGGAAAVSLNGWFLTDDPFVPHKYPLAGTLPAGSFATFTIAGLDLDAAGDQLQLYQDAVLVDSIAFGVQVTNLSIGRVGRDAHWTLCSPTPHAANVPVALGAPDGLRFNELLAAPGGRFSETWLELTNLGPAPVALAGLTLTDNLPGNPAAYTFPALSFIGVGGFVQLPFTLDAQGGSIALRMGNSTLDAVQFQPQTADVSLGRDASGALTFFPRPTRGFVNGVTEPAAYQPWLAWHVTSNGTDSEADGLVALAEFALGADPHFADGPAHLPTAGRSADDRAQLAFFLPQNPAVAQAHGRSEITYTVQASDSLAAPNWTSLATKPPASSWTGIGTVTLGSPAGGFVPVTVRDVAPVTANPRRFLRLVIDWTP